MPPKVINFYEQVEKKLRDEEVTYDNEKELQIKLSFRMLLIGSTGSGKTNTCLNLVKQINAWDRILLFARNVEEPLWAQFIKNFREAEKQSHTEILTVDTDLTHLPSVDKWDRKSHVLLILDDMMSENPKTIKTHVVPWWTRGRKKNASCIWMGQSYYDGTPLILRQNSDYIVLNKVLSNNDLHRILSEYPLDVSKDEIERLYHEATKGGFPNFFLIDLKAGHGSVPAQYRYRHNFEPLKYKTLSGDSESGNKEEKKGKTRGRVGVTVTPHPKKAPYHNVPTQLRPDLDTVPAGARGVRGRLLDFVEWFGKLPQDEQHHFKERLQEEKTEAARNALHLIRQHPNLRADEDEVMYDPVELQDAEQVLGRVLDDMELDEDLMEGDGLRAKKKRRTVGGRAARSAARPLARHTNETQKALERLAGRRLSQYWS